MGYRQPASSMTGFSWVAPAFEMRGRVQLPARDSIFLLADLIAFLTVWTIASHQDDTHVARLRTYLHPRHRLYHCSDKAWVVPLKATVKTT